MVEGGEGKGKCPAQLVQGSQRRNQLQRSRTGPSLSGLGVELDWLQGPVIKVKRQHSGPDSRKPSPTCPLPGQLSGQPARLQLLQPGQLQKNWVKAEKESHGCRSESGADKGMLLLKFIWNRKIWNQQAANSQ